MAKVEFTLGAHQSVIDPFEMVVWDKAGSEGVVLYLRPEAWQELGEPESIKVTVEAVDNG